MLYYLSYRYLETLLIKLYFLHSNISGFPHFMLFFMKCALWVSMSVPAFEKNMYVCM